MLPYGLQLFPLRCTAIIKKADGRVFPLVSNDHLSFLSSLWSLAILVPSIALSVRRLHDINKPGWWLAIFYGAVFAGAILMIVGGGAALFGVLRVWGSPSDSGYYATAAAGSLGILFIGAIIAAAAGIVYIVFMTLPSKPEGARFDDDFAAASKFALNSFLISSSTSLATPTTCSAAQVISPVCSTNLSAPTLHTGHCSGAAGSL